MGLYSFDDWASTFGEVVSSFELAPDGTGYRVQERFSSFNNIPELMNIFREVADIQTPDMLKLPVPKLKNNEYTIISSEPTKDLKEFIQNLAERSKAIKGGGVNPKVDNMLLITNEGKKAALDMRLLDSAYDDYATSKINKVVDNVYRIYKENEDIKGTQLLFSDMSTPTKIAGKYDVYNDIRNKLIEKGIPSNEIEFIHNAETDSKKASLFKRVRTGDTRILLGSTSKMGAGTNVQDRLVALHHIDVPWRPSDVEQREGRILRQGNMNNVVDICRYVTKESFDAYSWQLIETKQKFISQIYRGDTSIRKMQDLDNSVMNYAQIKAIASGNPMILEKFKIDNEVQKLQDKERNYRATKYRLEDSLKNTIPDFIKATQSKIEKLKNTLNKRQDKELEENCNIEINNKTFHTYKEAGAEILEFSDTYMELNREYHLGTYRGFELKMINRGVDNLFKTDGEARKVIKICCDYNMDFDLLKIPSLNIKKLDEKLDEIEELISNNESKIKDLHRQEEQCKIELEKPFEYQEKLNELLKRKNEIDSELRIDEEKNNEVIAEETEEKQDNEETEDEECESEEFLEEWEEEYVLNEEIKTITLTQDQITDIQFTNEKIKGYIQVTKTSSEDNKYSKLTKGSPLPDASFEVYDSGNNLVDTIKTNGKGVAVTKELLKGKYTIKEISSAKYYLLNEKIYNAEIVNDQEIVNVDITNDNVDIDVEVNKTGFIETQSKDDVYYNFKNIKNKSNVALDEFSWYDTLPTDAVRINRLYTGTWNEDLQYDVYYKTNKSDEYILFKKDLNTQKIYELNFNELQLQDDEYVTEYEFRFGKVKIGFQEVENPILYCDILEGLGNGYVFTNHTRVKGKYFEEEVEDKDDWTTITYQKKIKVDNVLPRTRNID